MNKKIIEEKKPRKTTRAYTRQPKEKTKVTIIRKILSVSSVIISVILFAIYLIITVEVFFTSPFLLILFVPTLYILVEHIQLVRHRKTKK